MGTSIGLHDSAELSGFTRLSFKPCLSFAVHVPRDCSRFSMVLLLQ